ncbi:MAG TPA: MinD/ParA family protein, partial [Desulfobaccales bacterium]
LHNHPGMSTPKLTVAGRCQASGPRVMTVTSGKGGVGKSNIVANLGLALARLGERVLLIDADLGLANLDILLGISPQYTIKDVLSLQQSLDQVIIEGPGGLKVLPACSGVPEMAELDQFQKAFLLNELDYYSAEIDVVLIDTGAGISRNVLFFNLAAQERLLVANNQPTALTDAYALMKIMVTRHNQKRFNLLVNGVTRAWEAEAVHRTLLRVAEHFLGRDVSIEYLGFIPYDQAIPRAVLRQQPVLALYPEAPASQSFTRIARQLRESPPPEGIDGGIQFFWRRLLGYQF